MSKTERERRTGIANRATWVGLISNLALTIFKFAAGLLGRSGAMVADAIHSLSDLGSDIVVLVSFRFVCQPADQDHPYGHGKYETLAAATIGGILLAVGVGVFYSAALKIRATLGGESLPAPGAIALVAAVVSIGVKELLYRYVRRMGNRIDSPALIASAWHHRTDALSSVGTMLGIGGAMLLGSSWHVLDPVAAIIVSLLVIRVAFGIFSGSMRELTESSLDEDTCEEIIQLASSIREISDPHNLRTRRIGSDIAIDLHIRVDPAMRVAEAHDVATRLEVAIRRRFGQGTFVSIHVEPEDR